MSSSFILSIDQGTTSTRTVVYDAGGETRGTAAFEIAQHYPRSGWVEHDPEDIWRSVADVVPHALEAAAIDANGLTAIGVTNQRETVLLWERATGKAVTPAVVWQDRRTSDFCRQPARGER